MTATTSGFSGVGVGVCLTAAEGGEEGAWEGVRGEGWKGLEGAGGGLKGAESPPWSAER